jgi:MFS family permease
MENDTKILGVRKNIFFLGLVSFFNDFSAEMVQAVMPVFLTVVLGAPAFFVGFVEGAADALSSVLKLVSGWVSDKIGKRKSPAIWGYGLSVFVRSFLAMVQNFWQVFGLRVVDRIGKGLRDAPRDALIAESVPREELGRSYGFHRAMDTLGATIGPLSAFFLLPLLGGSYRKLFLIAFVLGLLAIGSFVFVKEKKVEGAVQKPRPRLDWNLFRAHRKFIRVVFSIFVFGLGALPIGLVLLKAKEVGSISEVPLMYFVYSLAFVLAAIPLGRLADRIGERAVIAGGFVLAVLAYLGLWWSAHIFALTLFFIVLGIYSAATDGMQRMLAAKALGAELVATGQGFLNMALGFSSLGAGLIGGFLWTAASSGAALLYAAAVSFFGFVLFLSLSRRSS